MRAGCWMPTELQSGLHHQRVAHSLRLSDTVSNPGWPTYPFYPDPPPRIKYPGCYTGPISTPMEIDAARRKNPIRCSADGCGGQGTLQGSVQGYDVPI